MQQKKACPHAGFLGELTSSFVQEEGLVAITHTDFCTAFAVLRILSE